MRYCDYIGFVTTTETPADSGIWRSIPTERLLYGNVISNSVRVKDQSLGGTNKDISLSNKLSVLADDYALSNIGSIRYAKFMNVTWEVTDIDVSELPRITLTLGGVYNGEQA